MQDHPHSDQPTHHGWAVNVKDHQVYDVTRNLGRLSEDRAQAIYDRHAEGFWEDVQDVARKHGFEGVWSEGRMGGWAQPYPQPEADDMLDPDVQAWEEEHFRPFERATLELMEDTRGEMIAAVIEARRLADAEPAEAAYWAARDTITI